jgi:PIN domain nuclease of toxin-antitoxin system
LTAAKWFQQAVAATGAKIIPVKQRIACAAALVPDDTGHKDPGDCILIATAKVRNMPIITRDEKMIEMAGNGYLNVIEC